MQRENIRNSFIERSGTLTSLNLRPEAHLQGLVCAFLEAESSTGYSFISWLPEGESIQLVTTRWWTGGQFHSTTVYTTRRCDPAGEATDSAEGSAVG